MKTSSTFRLPLSFAGLLLLLPFVCAFDRAAAEPLGKNAGRSFQYEEDTLGTGALRRWFSERMRLAKDELDEMVKPHATSGVSTWTGGTGNWSDGSMWNPSGAPNSDGADVFVDGGNAAASVVSVDGNFTAGRLTIDAGDTVNILDNCSLSFTNTGGFSGAGSIVNNGVLSVTTQGNFTTLYINSAVSLSGTGVLTLTRDAGVTNANNSFIRGGGTLTNSSTIQGEGNVGTNETGLVNQAGGIVQANVSGRVLAVDPNGASGMSNAGILRASGGGVLQLTGSGGGDFINTGTGSIQANGMGSEVQLLNSARISGGTLSTSGGGVIRTVSGQTSFLDGLTNAGNFIGNDNSATVLSGTITNTGDLMVTTDGNLTTLRIDSAATLTGAGTVTLTRNAGATNSSNARIAGGGTLTNASTIQGEGNVGSNETALINQSSGIVQANVSGRVLAIDPNNASGLSNAGVLRANAGSVLQLSGSGGGDFVNTSTGSIQANGAGAEVQLVTNARISGGTLSTSGGGIIRSLNGQTIFLDGLTNAGTFVGSDNSSTVLSGTITNSGDFTFTTEGNFTNLRVDTSATLAGAGVVTLARNAGATGSSNARLSGGGTLTNASTIQGEGYVGSNETTIVNQAGGIIQANISGRALQLDPVNSMSAFTNLGLLRAINGGILQLTGNGGGIFNNTGGVIRAEAGSEVQLINGVTVSGGTLSTMGADALLHTLNGNTVTLDNLTIAGTYTGSDNSTTILTGGINNTGDLTLITEGNFTNLRVDGSATLQAGGTVTLARNAGATSVSNSRIIGNGTLTNASTIQGEGNVGANELTVVNQTGGIIQANVLGRVLALDSLNVANSFINSGVLRATNGGVLQFTGNGAGDFNNVGTGSIQANGAGSEVQLVNNAVIHGGTLSTSSGGVIRTINGNSATLDTLTNAGTFIGNDNSSTSLTGTLTNTGDLTIISEGNLTDLRIDGAVTLNGSGAVTLARNASATSVSNARIRGGGTLTNNSTIQGEGFVGANEMAIVNSATGLIQANIAGRALVIDPSSAAGSYFNSGIFRAINGGILQLSGSGGGDFNNTGVGTIQAIGAGSEVQLINNAAIRGGTLISSGGGLFRNPSGGTGTLDGVTNPGNFIGNDNSTTFLQNTINNTGDMTFTTDGNLTDVRIDGNTTLTGSGTITLARNAAATSASNTRIRGGGTLTNGSTIQGEGNVGANETTVINTSGGVIQANVSGRTLTLDPGSSATGLTNNTGGTLRASNGGTLNLTGNGGGSFTNNGTFEALDASSLFMDGSAVLTNNASGVLSNGIYRALANGNGATITIRGGAIATLAGAEVVLSGVGSIFQNDTTAIESSLTTNAGILRILANRSYTNVNALSSSGLLELGGGTFDAPSLTSSGEIFGFGAITPRPTNSGLIRAVGGTLSLTNGVGSTGTVQSDASGILSLTASSTASSSNLLANNGSLALGGQNFVVNNDYTNANFGVGNAFNPRANVSGAGLILAAGNVNQSLTGVTSGGAGTTPLLAFGNIHVGDAPTLNYQINNSGTSGPVLRGALQTSANGGNIIDGRLIGAGVTASNFGPIGLGANSGNLAVTFNGTSAGALSSQVLHIINNFDNVQDQNLSITGAAFRYANPTAHTPEPVAFGNFHVGDTAPSQALSITNNVPNDGFSESLNAVLSNATGGVLINNGSFTGLAPSATNNSSLVVSISTANAGNQSGTATIGLTSNGTDSSNLPNTALPSQTVNVTAGVYRYANPVVNTTSPVQFGVVHVGDTVAGRNVSLTNNVPADGFSESLNAGLSSGASGITTSGSITALAPGATNSTSLSIGLNTATAGSRNGSVTVGLVSNSSGSSNLPNTPLPSQTLNVTGQVNFFADPLLVFKSGSATLTMTSATSFTLDFGAVAQNSGTYLASFGVQNVLHDATFQDSLGGSFNTATVANFILAGFGSFSGVAPGGMLDPDVSFNSNRAFGLYSDSLLLNPNSTNASGTTGLNAIQLTLRAQVVPEPGTWAMLVLGAGTLVAIRKRRKS